VISHDGKDDVSFLHDLHMISDKNDIRSQLTNISQLLDIGKKICGIEWRPFVDSLNCLISAAKEHYFDSTVFAQETLKFRT